MSERTSTPETDTKGLASPLNPSPEQMRHTGYQVVDQLVDYLTTLPNERVARRGTSADFAALVDEFCPEQGRGIQSCLDFFFSRVAPAMTKVNHPRFHAYIPCPSSFVGMVGAWLTAGSNPFTGSWLGGATVASLEVTVLRWISELLQCPGLAQGIFTSGGSMANLVGLAAARAKYGQAARERGTLYVSREGHASLDKAAQLLGFSKDAIRRIGVDVDFRLDVLQLTAQVEADRRAGRLPFFVAANAGTTNTGAIDPCGDIAALCKAQGLWFHVDAAYGGFAALLPEVREAMVGIEHADSLTLDPHKWLYCPMGIGCALVRDVAALETAFGAEGDYLKDIPKDEVNFFNRGPELSRPARVLPVWMVLRACGKAELQAQIRRDIELATLAQSLLRESENFEIVSPGLSIVPFRHQAKPGESEEERAARDDALMEATLADGSLMLSTTYLGGKNTLRLVVMNPQTTEADIRHSVARIHALSSTLS